jgi:3-oxoacid CoA-transferase subunit B
VKGMGGAMDLVSGVERVIVLMEHCAKNGEHKILQECTLPLTGRGVVNRIITDLGVFDVAREGLTAAELAPEITLEEVRLKTGCHVHVSHLRATA